jgi:hypothetical protein
MLTMHLIITKFIKLVLFIFFIIIIASQWMGLEFADKLR